MPEGIREKFIPDPFWICWYQLNIYPYPRNKSDVICVGNSIGHLALNGSNVPSLRPSNIINNSATQSSRSALFMW